MNKTNSSTSKTKNSKNNSLNHHLSSKTINKKKPYDCRFKFVLVGDSGVGKSALLCRFTDQMYYDSYIATIGVDFKVKTIVVDDLRVKLEIWDTAGQERFRSIARCYYRNADAAIVVFDISERESFSHVQDWVDEITSTVQEEATINNDNNNNNNDRPGIACILVGNKCDLESRRKVPKDLAHKFALDKHLLYLETSARDNRNVYAVFQKLARIRIKMLENHREQRMKKKKEEEEEKQKSKKQLKQQEETIITLMKPPPENPGQQQETDCC